MKSYVDWTGCSPEDKPDEIPDYNGSDGGN
jgi:hypothetical protein